MFARFDRQIDHFGRLGNSAHRLEVFVVLIPGATQL